MFRFIRILTVSAVFLGFFYSCSNVFNPIKDKGSSNSNSTNTNSPTNSYTPPAGLVLWNKLGSDSDVTNSAYGSNLTLVGTPTYASGYFGSGYSAVSETSYIILPKSAINPTNGTIEFWFKPNFNSSAASCNTFLDTDGTGGAASNRFILALWDSSSFINGVFGPSAPYAQTAPSWTSGNQVHLAMVWDSAGVTGSSDQFRVYVNGVMLGHTNLAIYLNPSYTLVYLGRHLSTGVGEAANGVIDNLKIWNYAKTNFADRFTEAP